MNLLAAFKTRVTETDLSLNQLILYHLLLLQNLRAGLRVTQVQAVGMLISDLLPCHLDLVSVAQSHASCESLSWHLSPHWVTDAQHGVCITHASCESLSWYPSSHWATDAQHGVYITHASCESLSWHLSPHWVTDAQHWVCVTHASWESLSWHPSPHWATQMHNKECI